MRLVNEIRLVFGEEFLEINALVMDAKICFQTRYR
jgi:hypothetical protein